MTVSSLELFQEQQTIAFVCTVESLTVQTGQTASRHHSCHIHQRRWPAAGLVLQLPLSSPGTPSWRQQKTGRSGHGVPGSEIPHLEERESARDYRN